jgi:hypothetical protein
MAGKTRALINEMGKAAKGIRTAVSGKGYALLLLIIWLASVVVLGVWGAANSSRYEDAAGEPQSACPTSVLAEADEPATMDMRPNSRSTVAYGREVGVRHAALDFELTDPAGVLPNRTCLEVEVGPFVRDTNDGELASEQITAESTVQGDRALVTVKFDRQDASFGRGGSYSGFVSVIDERVQRVDIPVTVTLAYPIWQYPLAVTVLVLLPAFLYVVAKLSVDPATLSGAQKYLSTGEGFAAAVAGAVASLGVYMTVYLQSATWDADVLQYFALIAAAVAAFVTLATLPGKVPTE